MTDMPAAFIALGALLRDPEPPVAEVVAAVLARMGGYDPKTKEPIKSYSPDARKAWTEAVTFLSRAKWPEVAERAQLAAGDAGLEKRFEEFKTSIMNEIKEYWLKWVKEHGGR